jgi:hypothetical protein
VLKSVVDSIEGLLVDTLQQSASLQLPVLSAYERRQFKASNEHIVGLILLWRQQLASLIQDLSMVCYLHISVVWTSILLYASIHAVSAKNGKSIHACRKKHECIFLQAFMQERSSLHECSHKSL